MVSKWSDGEPQRRNQRTVVQWLSGLVWEHESGRTPMFVNCSHCLGMIGETMERLTSMAARCRQDGMIMYVNGEYGVV